MGRPMRTKRIATGIAGGALAFLLAACGGGSDQAGAAASSSSASKQTTPAVTALPQTGGIPDQPVCSVISKEAIEQAIGKKVYSSSDVDILAGEQPTLCNYYTDTDAVDGVTIQWMTRKQADWDNQVASLGDNGAGTVRTQADGLGDVAIKEVANIAGQKALGYDVLLKNRDMVLFVNDTSGLPDAAVRNATKVAIAAVDKL
jgi:hypothetical protein